MSGVEKVMLVHVCKSVMVFVGGVPPAAVMAAELMALRLFNMAFRIAGVTALAGEKVLTL